MKKNNKWKEIIVRCLRAGIFGTFSGGIAGTMYALSSFSNRQSHHKSFGAMPFPEEFPEDFFVDVGKSHLRLPQHLVNSKRRDRCDHSNPISCKESIDCQKSCGPRYMCHTVTHETRVDGKPLDVGKRYCLPVHYDKTQCKLGAGVIDISYDLETQKPSLKCSCKYPDIFSGFSCDEVIACTDPRRRNLLRDPFKNPPKIGDRQIRRDQHPHLKLQPSKIRTYKEKGEKEKEDDDDDDDDDDFFQKIASQNFLAPLVDRKTGLEIDLNDSDFLLENNLYETMHVPRNSTVSNLKLTNGTNTILKNTGPGQNTPANDSVDAYKEVPRFYCGCKKLSKYLTSAIDPSRCMKDPCFQLQSMTIATDKTERKNYSTKSATSTDKEYDGASCGWRDGTVDNTRLNCDCGDFRVSRLAGGGENPCLPFMDPDCGNATYDYKAYGGYKCECGPDQIFVPCRNKYRPDAVNLPLCGTDGSYVLRHDAPEAGACVNVCLFCDKRAIESSISNSVKDVAKMTSACQDDVRTRGHCSVNKTLPAFPLEPGSTQAMFDCTCFKQDFAKWWLVESSHTTGQCKGSKPPCKGFLSSCDREIDYGWQGPQCCRGPLICGQKPKLSVCLLDFGLST